MIAGRGIVGAGPKCVHTTDAPHPHRCGAPPRLGVVVAVINPDAWLTRAQAAQYAGVSTNTIGKWHAQGWLAPDGAEGRVRRHLTVKRRRDGNLLYRLGDVVDAERDTRNNTNSPRNPLRAGARPWAELNRQTFAA